MGPLLGYCRGRRVLIENVDDAAGSVDASAAVGIDGADSLLIDHCFPSDRKTSAAHVSAAGVVNTHCSVRSSLHLSVH
jgi:hypothetical protein